jgi:hypothetical protein
MVARFSAAALLTVMILTVFLSSSSSCCVAAFGIMPISSAATMARSSRNHVLSIDKVGRTGARVGGMRMAGFGGAGGGGKTKKGKSTSTTTPPPQKLKLKSQWDRYVDLQHSSTPVRVAVRVIKEDGTTGEWLEVGKIRSLNDEYNEMALRLQRGLVADVSCTYLLLV